jgi:hypothetical protein
MNILRELTALLSMFAPVETGVFSDAAPDTYIVITPLNDNFELYCDDFPSYETQEARLSLYSKSNYMELKNSVASVLLLAGFMITARQYIAHEDETGYFHYSIDVAKLYAWE